MAPARDPVVRYPRRDRNERLATVEHATQASSPIRAFALVGPGRAGTARALALAARGWRPVAVAGEHRTRLDRRSPRVSVHRAVDVADAGRGADLVVARHARRRDRRRRAPQVAPSLEPGALVIHLSGAATLRGPRRRSPPRGPTSRRLAAPAPVAARGRRSAATVSPAPGARSTARRASSVSRSRWVCRPFRAGSADDRPRPLPRGRVRRLEPPRRAARPGRAAGRRTPACRSRPSCRSCGRRSTTSTTSVRPPRSPARSPRRPTRRSPATSTRSTGRRARRVPRRWRARGTAGSADPRRAAERRERERAHDRRRAHRRPARRAASAARDRGRTVGLVPTMGFFHEGHRSLMRGGTRRPRPRRHHDLREPAAVRPERGPRRLPARPRR